MIEEIARLPIPGSSSSCSLISISEELKLSMLTLQCLSRVRVGQEVHDPRAVQLLRGTQYGWPELAGVSQVCRWVISRRI